MEKSTGRRGGNSWVSIDEILFESRLHVTRILWYAHDA